MAEMTILAKGTDTPRTHQGNLAPGLYAWPYRDGWIVQEVEDCATRGAFASTLDAAHERLIA